VSCAGGPERCGTVFCEGACNIECLGPKSCHFLYCSGGPCDVTCSGLDACDNLDCTAACSCDATCDADACYFDPQCPGLGGGDGPCGAGKGCTSAGSVSCDTCAM
jgi:hypothetical protein